MNIRHSAPGCISVFLFLMLLVTAAPPSVAALPVCQSTDSDPDGDGFGWESSQSCRVMSNTPTVATRPTCASANSDPDGDGYGWENNATCLVAGNDDPSEEPPAEDSPTNSSTPSSRPLCSSAAVDPDGDGWGWENNASCIVVADDAPELPPQSDTGSHPACNSSASDPDGDGFGWENNDTCIVQTDTAVTTLTALSPGGSINTGTPAFRWQAIADVDMYRIEVSDAGGNGYQSSIDPLSAGCQDGTGQCTHAPDFGYFDNHLSWHVEALVGNAVVASSNSLPFTTPVSLDMQPILSNTGSCEAWPAVAYDKYVLLNNSWNSRSMARRDWTQTIHIERDASGRVTPSWNYNWLGQFDGDEIAVKAYPEVLYGPKLGTHVSGTKAETGLPELVHSLPEFTIDYAYSETGSAERNVAIESFFHSSCAIAGPCDDIDNRVYEMMVWVDNPTIRTPGRLAVTGVMIDNQLWDVYIKPNSNKHYIAFTAQNPQSSGRINWNRFIDWTRDWTAANAESRGIDVLRPDFCMGAIEIGTELWWGEGSFQLDRFDVNFQPR